MRKFLIMSAVVLGMAALTTTEVKAKGGTPDDGGEMDHSTPMPPRPGTHPYPGGPTPWDWKPWENPQNTKP